MKDFSKTSIIVSLIVTVFVACEKPNISDDQEFINNLYAEATDTITIDTSEHFLETYLYRNFMPGAFKNRSLIASIFLINADSLPISKELTITKLYVIKNDLVWISIPDDFKDSYLPEFKLEKISRDGPEWETGIYVDVVAEILYILTKDKYLLIARHQYIERAD